MEVIMRYKKTRKMLVAVAALLCCTALSIGTVYADTDGTDCLLYTSDAADE